MRTSTGELRSHEQSRGLYASASLRADGARLAADSASRAAAMAALASSCAPSRSARPHSSGSARDRACSSLAWSRSHTTLFSRRSQADLVPIGRAREPRGPREIRLLGCERRRGEQRLVDHVLRAGPLAQFKRVIQCPGGIGQLTEQQRGDTLVAPDDEPRIRTAQLVRRPETLIQPPQRLLIPSAHDRSEARPAEHTAAVWSRSPTDRSCRIAAGACRTAVAKSLGARARATTSASEIGELVAAAVRVLHRLVGEGHSRGLIAVPRSVHGQMRKAPRDPRVVP